MVKFSVLRANDEVKMKVKELTRDSPLMDLRERKRNSRDEIVECVNLEC